MTNDALLGLYLARDEQAIAETQKQFGGYLYKVAFNILGCTEDAEECVNDTLMRLWNAIPPAHPENLYAYSAAISRNLARNRYQQQNAQQRGGGQIPAILEELSECLSASDDVEAEVSMHSLTEAINRFLEDLPKRHRVIFVQRYFYHAEIAEIAADLHLTKSYVTVSLTRTRKKLWDFLKKEEFI